MSRRTARLWKGIAILLLPLMLTTAAATAPVFQSTLIFADGSEPIGLYPPPGIGPPGSLFYLLYDPLVGFNAKMVPDPRFGLATSWAVGPDNVTWTFHLRRNIKFQDGTPFDANAVKVTLDSIIDPATGAYRRKQPCH